MLNLQPNLSGDLLQLRPLREDDFDSLFAVARDQLIWEQHPDNNRYQETVFLEFFADALSSRGALIVIDAESGNVIGSSRFHAYCADRRSVEIGWTFLARTHWGGTYNAELKRLMLSHAFPFVDTVIFFVGIDNIRSQKAVEKIGGRRTGTRENSVTGTDVRYELTELAYRTAQVETTLRKD